MIRYMDISVIVYENLDGKNNAQKLAEGRLKEDWRRRLLLEADTLAFSFGMSFPD